MKVLYPDNYASGFVGTNIDSDFPVSNVQDEHPKYVCKSNSNWMNIAFIGAANANTIALFNSNASSITALVGYGISLEARSPLTIRSPLELRSNQISTDIYDQSGSAAGSLWGEYTALPKQHRIELQFLASAGTIVKAGVILAGIRKEYDDPFYDMQEGLHSFDVVEMYNGGEVHIDDGDTVRTFQLFLLEDLDPDWWEFMFNVAQMKGMHPMAYRLISTSTDREWIVYARFNGTMPSGRHQFVDNDGNIYSALDISLIEVI